MRGSLHFNRIMNELRYIWYEYARIMYVYMYVSMWTLFFMKGPEEYIKIMCM